MNHSTIGYNIKRLRTEQNWTQQALAEALSISFQAVSKWETGLTLPDVMLLPTIAACFGVTIDELFRPNLTVYRHKAQRLLAQYENHAEDRELFRQTDREYQALFQSRHFTEEDLAEYAYLLECHARYLLKSAETYYRKALDRGSRDQGAAYYKILRQYHQFLARIGRAQESICQCRDRVAREPENPMAHASLIAAFLSADELEYAVSATEQALALFPRDGLVLTYAGYVYQQLGEYDRAETCWKQAFREDPELIDAQYALAQTYLERHMDSQAEEVLRDICVWNRARGYDLENQWPEQALAAIRQEQRQST